MLCSALAVTTLLCSDEASAHEIRAGVAQGTFELPRWVPLAGYSQRKGTPSQGVHDPVGVRALIVEGEGVTAALVSADLLIIDEQLFDVVRRRLIAQGLPNDLVLILAATHTHSGPGAYGRRFLEKISMGHFDPKVGELLAQTIAHTVLRAYAARAPAHLAYGAVMTEGLVVNRMEAGGMTDAALVVCAFYHGGEALPFAVILNFSAHPTTLGAWNTLVSADYPGVVERELERRFPGMTCLFFAGSVGDQAPVKAGIGYERAEWIGMTLAEASAALLGRLRPVLPGGLQARQERFALPPAQLHVGRLAFPRWLGQRLVDDDATLSVVAVGSTVFVGVPCDLSASLGERLKRAAQAERLTPVVVGFASDYIGYCVPEALYKSKRYESSMAFNGPKAGELLVERLIEMLKQLVTSDRPQATSDERDVQVN